jgi:hypothetical protein
VSLLSLLLLLLLVSLLVPQKTLPLPFILFITDLLPDCALSP